MYRFASFFTVKASRIAALGLTTSLFGLAAAGPVLAQGCENNGGCKAPNAGLVVRMPTQPNVELEPVPHLGVSGYQFSIDGNPIAQDGTILRGKGGIIADRRREDMALAAQDISVKFDGLAVPKRLDVRASHGTGGAVQFRSAMNYPAFVSRGELRLIDPAAKPGSRVIAVAPLDPNGTARLDLPARDGLVYVYRVYDAQGRFDETAPRALSASAQADPASGAEEGTDTTYLSNIPVRGGAVTVSGSALGGGAAVTVLGEKVHADAGGSFAVQRILPVGQHRIAVQAAGKPALARSIVIPQRDMFYVGLVDVMLRKNIQDQLAVANGGTDGGLSTRGRIAGFVQGTYANGSRLTAAIDTGEDDLGNLLNNLDRKDPLSLLERIDPDLHYPVYGDDSTAENMAPTAGRLYLKLEKAGNHVMWGSFRSQIGGGTQFLRQDRTLYGAQAVAQTSRQGPDGTARARAEIYAAQPETLPQRDQFLGTGGSAYFLKFRDITRASETLVVETRDTVTGRVVSRRTLEAGKDYQLNYNQGLVLLKTPLSGSGGGSVAGGGATKNYLVATYEHTPTAVVAGTFSYGGRAQAWVTDKLRFGATFSSENLGTSRQDAAGVDMRYQATDNSFVELEYARTNGTGSSSDLSLDGGLTFAAQSGASGNGTGLRFNGQLGLADVGLGDGQIGAYYEDRSAGFSALGHQAATAEKLWGVNGEIRLGANSTLSFAHDDTRAASGKHTATSDLTLSLARGGPLKWEIGVGRLDKTTPGQPAQTGQRTDLGIKLTYALADDTEIYGYGRGTVQLSGGLARNDRLGFGGKTRIGDNWTVSGELSSGTAGVGGKVLAEYQRDADNSFYFGYTLDPTRTLDGVVLNGRDQGAYVLGARRRLNDSLSMFAENTYDLFGAHRSLTSTYGAEYSANNSLTFTGGLEFGRISDSAVGTNLDRIALTLGSHYNTEKLVVRSRLEVRRDRGVSSGSNQDADTIALSLTGRYAPSDTSRFLFSAKGVQSVNAAASIPDAKFFEGTLGYALRPLDNDRLNVLAKYDYLYDMTARNAAPPASGANFNSSPRQKAQILTVDASYDLSERLTLGGKIGGRWSVQDNGAGFVSNNAILGVVNLRFHVVHKWDGLIELRSLRAQDIGSDTGLVVAGYRHFGNNLKFGIGYNFGSFSDDLRDVTYNDSGIFLNIVGKF